jgi:hypothetical protein
MTGIFTLQIVQEDGIAFYYDCELNRCKVKEIDDAPDLEWIDVCYILDNVTMSIGDTYIISCLLPE